jgi:peptidoglycan-associated lipoprotein
MSMDQIAAARGCAERRRRGFAIGAAGVALSALVAGCAGGGGHPTLAPAPVASAASCVQVSFPIYFSENSDQLTDPARQALDVAARQVRGCRIDYVSVIGLTDSVGAADENLELSKRRASAVAAALQAAGLPAPKFEVRGLGERGATLADGKAAPLRRRTDVVIHAAPRVG